MEVNLHAYLNKNLGDDLFIYILSNRYKDINFKLISNKRYYISKNVKILNSKVYKIYNFFRKNNNNKLNVLIGGSMFIENKSYDYPKIIAPPKKYIILGSNFGPFVTNNFYKKYYNFFAEAEDVCFRDTKSYNLFKDLPNVRYASDIVFSLDTADINIKDTNNVIISVINCDKKAENISSNEYEDKIIELITYLNNKGYNATLMSFCKDEGDEECINSIINKMKKNKVRKIPSKYFYRGDLHEALNVLGSSKIIVGTRFHANIIGMLMDKVIIPIAYSDKTINVLNDMNFEGKIFDVRKLEEFTINSLEEKDLNYKINVSRQKKDALKHFDKLDNILNEGRK